MIATEIPTPVYNHTKDSYPGHTKAFISELFGLIYKYGKTKQEKANMLREFMVENTNTISKVRSLHSVLNCIFLPEWKLDLPEGVPPHSQYIVSIDTAPSSLYRVASNLHYFLPENPGFIKNIAKREKVFASYFDSLFVGDAMCLIAMKDGNPFLIGLDYETVAFAIPGWFDPSKIEFNVGFEYNDDGTRKAIAKDAITENSAPQTEAPKKKKPGRKPKVVLQEESTQNASV